VSVRCPYCQFEIKLKGVKPGRFTPKCPKCARAFVLTVPEEAGQAMTAAPLRTAPTNPPEAPSEPGRAKAAPSAPPKLEPTMAPADAIPTSPRPLAPTLPHGEGQATGLLLRRSQTHHGPPPRPRLLPNRLPARPRWAPLSRKPLPTFRPQPRANGRRRPKRKPRSKTRVQWRGLPSGRKNRLFPHPPLPRAKRARKRLLPMPPRQGKAATATLKRVTPRTCPNISGLTRSSISSAREAWGRCTWPVNFHWTARSPSK